MKNCLLCGESLKSRPTNLEHYIYASTIRSFRKLGIPEKFTHALRLDECEEGIDALLGPISAHKQWATVEAHQDCNSKASIVCQHLKYIIDHLDYWSSIPESKIKAVTDYYAHIWHVKADSVEMTLGTPDYEEIEFAPLYMPGFYWLGRLIIRTMEPTIYCPSNEYLTVYLGTKKALEKVIGSTTDKS